jgi:hypothetical protein
MVRLDVPTRPVFSDSQSEDDGLTLRHRTAWLTLQGLRLRFRPYSNQSAAEISAWGERMKAKRAMLLGDQYLTDIQSERDACLELLDSPRYPAI